VFVAILNAPSPWYLIVYCRYKATGRTRGIENNCAINTTANANNIKLEYFMHA
jgi:hypothetical protein